MSSFSPNVRSSGNRPQHKAMSDDDLKTRQHQHARAHQPQESHHHPAYKQPVVLHKIETRSTEGRSSRRLIKESPRLPSSFFDHASPSVSPYSDATKSATTMLRPSLETAHMQQWSSSRKTGPASAPSSSSSSPNARGFLSSRPEPPLVASTSFPHRSPAMPTPPQPISARDPTGSIPISHISTSSRFTSKSETSIQQHPFPHATHSHSNSVYQQHYMPPSHTHRPLPDHRSNSAPQSPSYLAQRSHASSSGTLSDGGTSVASVVDMKRLLSKPALPSSAALPSHSDSEALSPPGSGVGAGDASSSRRTRDDSKFAQGKKGFMHDKPLPPLVIIPVTPTPPHQSSSSLEDPSAHTQPSSATSSPRDTKLRTVMKRRPSGPRSPSTPSSSSAAAVMVNLVEPNSTTQPAVPQLIIDSALSKRAGLHENEVNRSSSSLSSPLTPAGAVAEAYKQQEQRRSSHTSTGSGSGTGSGNGSGSGGERTPKIAAAPFSDMKLVGTGEEERPASPVPYYTVLGSTSGRLVAVGGPSDTLLDGYHTDGRHQYSKPESGRSLTRKVSAKWKKAIRGDRSAFDTSGSGADVDGRTSSEERRSTSLLGTDGSRAGGRSIDIHSPDAISTGEPMSAKAWSPGRVEDDVRVRSGKLVKLRGDRGRDSQKEKENEEEGGKIWKLVKRISTGGLRDKYFQAPDKTPPPVPALPKDHIDRSPRRSIDGDTSGVLSRFLASRPSMSPTPTAVHRSGSPRASTSNGQKVGPSSSSGRRPSTTTGSSSSPVSSDFASTRFFRPTHSAGSSSSSYGEDVPPPVPSTMIAQHIIPPSELYRMNMEHENEIVIPDSSSSSKLRAQQCTSPVSLDSLPPRDHSPEQTRASLPLPPRRIAARGNSPKRQQHHSKTSSGVPSFSTTRAINSYRRQTSPTPIDLNGQHDNDTSRPSVMLHMPQLNLNMSSNPPSSDGAPGTAPPPRPSKSPRPPRLGSMSLPQASLSPLKALSDETHDNARIRFDAGDPHRKSSGTISNASTVRQRSSPFSTSHASTPSQGWRPTIGDRPIHINTSPTPSSARSPLTFRELSSSPSARTPLTAQEKADIWDNLLERSDRAGGTIHLGGQGLISDEISLAGESRLSNYSEMTDIP